MILKIVILFLVFMGVMGMFGKLSLPWRKRLSSVRCPDCGRFRIGKGPCACRKDRRR